MQKDSVMRTIIIAAILCVVCSIAVSTSVVVLKGPQDENKTLDLKRNLLTAAGLITDGASKEEVLEAYKKIDTKVVDLRTGEYSTEIDPAGYDQISASRSKETGSPVPADKDLAKIRFREHFSKVYLVKEGDQVTQIVLPVRGKGLWSTMLGYISMKPDTKTVNGITFYEHGETPGLGGEIDNPKWKALWHGKVVLGEDNAPKFHLSKTKVTPEMPDAAHKIDSLAGATLTGRGVEHLINYWFSAEGFGPYLERVRTKGL